MEAQILKDSGIDKLQSETILTRPIKRSCQQEKPTSVKSAIFSSSPALTRSRTQPVTTYKSSVPIPNTQPSKGPTTASMNASGAFGGNGVPAYMTGNQGWTYTVQHPNAWMQATMGSQTPIGSQPPMGNQPYYMNPQGNWVPSGPMWTAPPPNHIHQSTPVVNQSSGPTLGQRHPDNATLQVDRGYQVGIVSQEVTQTTAAERFSESNIEKVPCDKNKARRNRRAAKRKFQEEMTQRKEQGLKPCKVTVDHRGYVETGKDEWYADLKALCLNYLDISIPQFAKQNSARVQLVKRDLGDRYEYDGGELSDSFVKGKILQILKGERNRLKVLWEEVGESKLDAPCPEDVDAITWKQLIKYWTSAEGVFKSDQASNARAQVVNLNTTGRAGYHSSIRQMKQEKGCSPTLKEARDRAYTPTGTEGDTRSVQKLSGSIPHRISSVEDSVQKYRGDLQKLQHSVDAQGKLLQQLLELMQAQLQSNTEGITEDGGECKSSLHNSGVNKTPLSLAKKMHSAPEDPSPVKESATNQASDQGALHVQPPKLSCKRDIFAEPGQGEQTETAREHVVNHEDSHNESQEEEHRSDVSKKVHPPLQPNTAIPPPQSRVNRRKQFLIGDEVVLKQPKNAKQEVGSGKIEGLQGDSVLNEHTDKTVIVPKGAVAVLLSRVDADITMELPYPIEQYPNFRAEYLADLEIGDLVLWNVAHTRRAAYH